MAEIDMMDQEKLIRMIKKVQKAAESLDDGAHKDAILGGLDATYEETQKTWPGSRNTTLLH